jgi:hypothetical protein
MHRGAAFAIMTAIDCQTIVGWRDCRGAALPCQCQSGWRCDGDIGKASHIRGKDQPLASIRSRLGREEVSTNGEIVLERAITCSRLMRALNVDGGPRGVGGDLTPAPDPGHGRR